LGIGDWAQSPIPNPQSPIPNPQSPGKDKRFLFIFIKIIINFLKLKIIEMNGKNSLSYKLKSIQKIQKELNNDNFAYRRRNNDDLIFNGYFNQKQNNQNINSVINKKNNFNSVNIIS
jgi:hypothetical protein